MSDKIMITYVAETDPWCGIATWQTLGSLKAKIDAYVEKYGNDAEYDIIIHDGWVDEKIKCKRLETNDEYQERIEREQRIQQQKEEKERKEFERLKAKYGS